MTKLELKLDNSYIPKLTRVNPNSPYLRFRRFYCKRKAIINPLLFVAPMFVYFIIRVIGG